MPQSRGRNCARLAPQPAPPRTAPRRANQPPRGIGKCLRIVMGRIGGASLSIPGQVVAAGRVQGPCAAMQAQGVVAAGRGGAEGCPRLAVTGRQAVARMRCFAAMSLHQAPPRPSTYSAWRRLWRGGAGRAGCGGEISLFSGPLLKFPSF